MSRLILAAAVTIAFAGGCGGGEESSATADATVNDVPEEVTILSNENCPVMGNPVAGGQFFDWEGYRIGICCPGCEASFKANPENFIPALLQDPGVSDEIKAELSSYLEESESPQ